MNPARYNDQLKVSIKVGMEIGVNISIDHLVYYCIQGIPFTNKPSRSPCSAENEFRLYMFLLNTARCMCSSNSLMPSYPAQAPTLSPAPPVQTSPPALTSRVSS